MNAKIRFAALPVALIAALGVASANAATSPQTGTFDVTVTVINSCTLDLSAADIAIGSTNLTSAATGSGDVKVKCTAAGPVSLAFSAGNSGNVAARTMAGLAPLTASDTIDYNIYPDTSYATPLGVTAGTNTIDFTSSGQNNADTNTVYAQVPDAASQSGAVKVGDYKDTITVTATF